MIDDSFMQSGYRCRIEWGRRGARMAAERGDVVVIVDTLSFSTAVATAVYFGGEVVPCASKDVAGELARQTGGEAAVSRRDVPGKGRFSLSPGTYVGIERGTRIVLASPNGATCSECGRVASYLFAGALVNARAVSAAVSALLDAGRLCVTVVACGERWGDSDDDGPLRMAIEDYLGAGAVLAGLSFEQSPEARMCAGAFRAVEHDLEGLLWECASGRQLRGMGYEDDVKHAARLNAYDIAPMLRAGAFTRARTQ